MSPKSASPFLLILYFLFFPSSPFAQTVEAGLHGGMALTGNPDYVPNSTESGLEYGIWLIIWPSDRFSLAADWSFIPQDDFMTSAGGAPVGERDRNRQYVDMTLQYHFWRDEKRTIFAEIGGGSHWNNRQVVNPEGSTDFEEAGKESTRTAVWTFGAGFRQRLLPHFHWISQVKLHNPGSGKTNGIRFMSGLSVSWN